MKLDNVTYEDGDGLEDIDIFGLQPLKAFLWACTSESSLTKDEKEQIIEEAIDKVEDIQSCIQRFRENLKEVPTCEKL